MIIEEIIQSQDCLILLSMIDGITDAIIDGNSFLEINHSKLDQYNLEYALILYKNNELMIQNLGICEILIGKDALTFKQYAVIAAIKLYNHNLIELDNHNLIVTTMKGKHQIESIMRKEYGYNEITFKEFEKRYRRLF